MPDNQQFSLLSQTHEQNKDFPVRFPRRCFCYAIVNCVHSIKSIVVFNDEKHCSCHAFCYTKLQFTIKRTEQMTFFKMNNFFASYLINIPLCLDVFFKLVSRPGNDEFVIENQQDSV